MTSNQSNSKLCSPANQFKIPKLNIPNKLGGNKENIDVKLGGNKENIYVQTTCDGQQQPLNFQCKIQLSSKSARNEYSQTVDSQQLSSNPLVTSLKKPLNTKSTQSQQEQAYHDWCQQTAQLNANKQNKFYVNTQAHGYLTQPNGKLNSSSREIKSQATCTRTYQKGALSRSFQQIHLECSSLGKNDMRNILRSSFQKQQDGIRLKSNFQQSTIKELSSIRDSLNTTTQIDSNNNSKNIEQSQQYISSHRYIKPQLFAERYCESNGEEDQNKKVNTDFNNIYLDYSHNNCERSQDLSLTDILNQESSAFLEESFDTCDYPSSPLIPPSVSRIYKNSCLDSQRNVQLSQEDFNISIIHTQFFDTNTLDFFHSNQFATEKILSYLDIKSCLNLCGSHNLFRSKKQRRLFNKQLKWLIIKGQLGKSLRAKYWVYISRADDFKRIYSIENYRHLSLCEPRCEREIIQDIDRTFPRIKEFRSKEKTFQLHKVLRALSFCLPDMEYCQGLNYIVGSLLLYAEEEESFYICVSMLKNYGLKDCFFEDLNGLQQAVKILDNLIKLYFPHIADFLQKKNIQTGLFATSWLSTLFSYDFPRSFFIRVNEDDILKVIKIAQSFSEEHILLTSQTFKITNRMIVDLNNILTKNPCIRNLNLSYDMKAKKRKWEYEIDSVSEFKEMSMRESNLQRQNERKMKKEEKPQKNFIESIIHALTPQFCGSSKVIVADYEKEIKLKKRDFKNFSTFSTSNLNGSRHFLLPLEDKLSVLEQWQGTMQNSQEYDINFDNQMVEQYNKLDTPLKNSIKSHPKKFIQTIKKSFVEN